MENLVNGHRRIDKRRQSSRSSCGLHRQALSAAFAGALWLVFSIVVSGPANAQKYSVLHSFAGGDDGSYPVAGLALDAKGNLYGTTSQGGAHNYGTVFELESAGIETVLYSFTDTAGDGAYPYASLLRDAKGTLYGTTIYGGLHNFGVVFQIDAAGNKTVLYSFTGGGDGAYPCAGLVRDTKGNLYGTTFEGGAFGYGTVFEVSPTGKETVLHNFPWTGVDGANPYAAVVRDAAGNLYGTAYEGGLDSCSGGYTVGCGVVFKLETTGAETLLHTFTGTEGDGANPSGGVVRDTAGNLFGTTRYSAGGGVVFRISETGQETVLYGFTGGVDGDEPWNENLVLDADGNLYGTTAYGGTYGYGTVFEVNATGIFSVLYSFAGNGGDGNTPMAGLVRDTKGNLYGTTAYGGVHGYGTVFKLAP